MMDMLADYTQHNYNLPIGTSYPTLLFADDTMLLTNTKEHKRTLLGLVIEHSKPYNLALNKTKCQLLVTNDPGPPVYFPDGTEVNKHEQIKYLGTTFSATLDINLIIRQKLTEAAATLRQLSPLWGDQQIKTAWKLVVFNAILRSRIFYTLESLEITPSQQRLLDTLFYRGLRKILKVKTTFVDRTWTNERLLATANRVSRRAAQQTPKQVDFSAYYDWRRRKLLAHLLRAPQENLCRKAILDDKNNDLVDSRR